MTQLQSGLGKDKVSKQKGTRYTPLHLTHYVTGMLHLRHVSPHQQGNIIDLDLTSFESVDYGLQRRSTDPYTLKAQAGSLGLYELKLKSFMIVKPNSRLSSRSFTIRHDPS